MKNLMYLLFGAFMIVACETDPCKDVVCGDYGACTEGVCLCETGYEQDADGACNTAVRAKYIASYSSSEVCASGNDSYNVNVTTSSQGITKFVFSNLYGAGVSTVADVDGSSSFTIASQTLGTGTVSGSGTIATDGTITLSYTFTNSAGSSDACTMTLTKL